MIHQTIKWVAGVASMSVVAADIPRKGLVLHLDAASLKAQASASEAGIQVWPDVSGHGHDVRQDDAAKRPRLAPRTCNGLPVVRFSGREFLDGPPVLADGDGSFTIIAVWRRRDSPGAQSICEQAASGKGRRAALLTVSGRYGFNGQNNDQHSLLPYRPGRFTISVLALDDTGRVRLWHNDDTGATGATGRISSKAQNTGADRFRVGAKAMTGGECLAGDIAEILVYDRPLIFDEVKGVNAYLGEKWSIGKKGTDGKRRTETMPTEIMDRGPDYTSRVPQYRFSDTLEAQEAELKANPLLRRFRESRRRLAADPYRPLYHFVSPESSMNDPNGLCFWRGRWHLFYQAYPPEDPRQHWGHAVSPDLIHWRDLPYAIYPNPEEKCFSGATLVEDNRVIAIYHGINAGTMVAVSSDPLLLNWKKVTGKAVIPLPQPGDGPLPYNIFDPCIWKHEGVYYALTAGTLPNGPAGKPVRAEFLHRSTDLASWEYLHPFLEDDRYGLVGDDGACPYFWPIGDRHILLHFSHMSGGKYLLGTYDAARGKFKVADGGDFNFGPAAPCGVHAPSAAPDGAGGVIVIFNMNPGKPTSGWNQIMSLPRRLSLSADGTLRMTPAGDIASLRSDHRHIDKTALPANREVVLENIRGNSMELAAEIDTRGAPVIELSVLRSPGREEYTRIAFYRDRGNAHRDRGRPDRRDSLITLDSSHSSVLPDVACRAPETAPVFLEPGEPLRLHVFIDRSVVEVFVNDKQCVALRVYPGREDSVGVSLVARGRDAQLTSLDAWRMQSIHPMVTP